MELLYRLVQLCEEVDAFLRDADDDDTQIFRSPAALHQSLRFEPIDDPRHVRHARDHPRSDLEARQAVASGAPKNAQHVVLWFGDPLLLEKPKKVRFEHAVRAHEVEERLLRRRFERPTPA